MDALSTGQFRPEVLFWYTARMKYKKFNTSYLLRFDRDEELIGSLEEFCKAEKIKSGFLHGLGGVTHATLGYYDLEKKKYFFRDCDDVVEIISLNGNITLAEGRPFVHLHGTLGNKKLETVAGHIKSLTIGGTAEIFLNVFEARVERSFDEKTGLNLLEI